MLGEQEAVIIHIARMISFSVGCMCEIGYIVPLEFKTVSHLPWILYNYEVQIP